MNGHHSYLLVEGQQDVFFIGRILENLGLRPVQTAAQLPAKWEPFLDDVLRQRDQAARKAGRAGIPFWQMFKPACLVNDSHAVVVERVEGNRAKFGRTLRATNALIDGGLASLTAVGLVPDANSDPLASFASGQEALRSVQLAVPARNEQVVAGPPNSGIFVLPGGGNQGGLEQLLLDCGERIYPTLKDSAQRFVESVDADSDEYTEDDLRELDTPQGSVKAIVGAMCSVLKPGSTIQVSILRNRWICATTMAAPRIAALVQFLISLCGLPQLSPNSSES